MTELEFTTQGGEKTMEVTEAPMEVNEALPAYKRYTYADYCTWDDDVRRELIDGVPYMMSAPNRRHQRILMQLSRLFSNFLVGNPCEVYAAPFDVRLNADSGDDTVVQPDLLVVCDRAKLDGKACVGAPDLAVEILSLSSVVHDKVIKLRWYLQAGVREYWIVDPEKNAISVNILKNNEYVTCDYGGGGSIPVHVLEGCTINLPEVFAE